MVKYGLWHRPRVSPMPRVERKASSLVLFGLLFAMAFASALGSVTAQDGTDGAGATNDSDTTNGTDGTGGDAGAGADPGTGTRILTIGADNAACDAGGCLWDTPRLVYVPGTTVILRADLAGAMPHNLKIALDDADVEPPFEVTYEPAAASGDISQTAAGTVVTATFTVPEDFDGEIGYYCTLHQPTMTGFMMTPADFRASGGEPEAIHHLGVHFLAYWVGLIAFAVLFVVYGITFFLFKYNETSATTDQWDRTGAGAPEVKNKMSSGSATLIAILIGIVALAAIIWLARMG